MSWRPKTVCNWNPYKAGSNTRTRYLDILEALFMRHEVANLALVAGQPPDEVGAVVAEGGLGQGHPAEAVTRRHGGRRPAAAPPAQHRAGARAAATTAHRAAPVRHAPAPPTRHRPPTALASAPSGGGGVGVGVGMGRAEAAPR